MQFAGEPVHSRQRYSNNLLIRDFDRNASVREKEEEEGEEEREREIVQGHDSDVISGHETRATQRRDVSRGSNLSPRPICLPTGEKGEMKESRERRERERRTGTGEKLAKSRGQNE